MTRGYNGGTIGAEGSRKPNGGGSGLVFRLVFKTSWTSQGVR